jgi:transposase
MSHTQLTKVAELRTNPAPRPRSLRTPARQEQPASQIKQIAKRLTDWWQRGAVTDGGSWGGFVDNGAEEKIRIVLEGLRGEDSIAELCRKEGINQNLYYRWSKEFLEAGKKRLAGDTAREATSDEVKELKAEARQLKETLAEVLIENRLLKKSVLGDGEDAS